MSFSDFKYEGDDGEIYLVRMDNDLQAAIATNVEPTGNVTKPFHLLTTGSNRRFGIIPREIIATRTFGTAPDIGVKRIAVTILTPAVIEGDPPAVNIGDTFTYSGNTWTVASLVGETEN